MGFDFINDHAQQINAARREWLRVALSTDPADFEAAEAAIVMLYAGINLPRPYFVRLSSPLAAEIYINLLTAMWPEIVSKSEEQLQRQLWDQPWEQLNKQLRNQLKDCTRDHLRDQFGIHLGVQLQDQLGFQIEDQISTQLGRPLWDQWRGPLWGYVRAQIGDQLRNQLGDQLGEALWNRLGMKFRSQLEDQFGGRIQEYVQDRLEGVNMRFVGTRFSGQWDAWIWGWADTGRRVGADYPKWLGDSLDNHCTLCRSCGAFYPFRSSCIVVDRPEIISLDEGGRLHAETGPAVKFRDGYSLWSWRGVRVPEYVIEQPSEITIKKINEEDNTEIRRVMIERYGWDRYLNDAGMEMISEDTDILGCPRRLWHKDIGDEFPLRLVEVVNSSPEPDGSFNKYFLQVPHETVGMPNEMDNGTPLNTPQSAIAWTFGMTVDEYKTQIET